MALLRPAYDPPADSPARSREEIEAELRAMLRQQREEKDGARKASDNEEGGILSSILGALVETAISVKLPEGDISGGWSSWGDGGDGGGGDGGGGGGD